MMKPLVNLATEPFRNRRLIWIAIFLMFLVPTYFAQQAIRVRAGQEAEIRTWQTIIRELEGRLGKTGAETSVTGTAISNDQNREIYAASELIARKSFSWTRLLNEIERNLPAGVRVLRVAVTTVVPEEENGAFGGAQSAATLNLEVIAKSSTEVVSLIDQLHRSGRFRVFPLTQKPVEGTGEVEFALKVEYLPTPGGQPAKTGLAKSTESAGSGAPRDSETKTAETKK